jgi:DNA-binding protein HU-beta
MKKADFIEVIREEGGYETKKEAENAVNAFTNAITKALKQKKSVSLVGFGSFNAVFQKGKTGKVPGTDKTYTSQDKYVPKFKAGKKLKEDIA